MREAVVAADSGHDAEAGRWALHPLDCGGEDDDYAGVRDGVYLGAAGMLWGLDRLSRAGAAESSIDLPAAAALLARARSFAMHALAQAAELRRRNGQSWFGLWTGDLGTALYAWQCIEGDPALPTLTAW